MNVLEAIRSERNHWIIEKGMSTYKLAGADNTYTQEEIMSKMWTCDSSPLQTISFLKDRFEKITDKKKTSTIRLGIKDYRIGPVRLITETETNRTYVISNILKIELITFNELLRGDQSESLVRSEGYKELGELVRGLQDIYGKIHPNQLLTVIHFI